MTDYETLIVEKHDRVGVVRINRPKARNALNALLLREMSAALEDFDADDGIGCIVLSGSGKDFAAGGDVVEMAGLTYPATYMTDFLAKWDRVAAQRKPMIAAVSGYALGGGCELAMMCDFIVAADDAQFGQPEITLGVMPGMGGTQRLARLIGTAKAMEICLTGRLVGAQEAERIGLVAKVLPVETLFDDVLGMAQKIASRSLGAAMMIKEAIQRTDEMSLAEGMRFERRLFYSTFATLDQKEGMAAFLEKRKPVFKNG